MAGPLMAIVALGLLGLVVFFAMLIISLVKKKPKKLSAIGLTVCVVVVIAASLAYPDSELEDYRVRQEERLLAEQEQTLQEETAELEQGQQAEGIELSENENAEPDISTEPEISIGKFLENGERISIIQNGDICVMKYKIKSSWNNEMTINQNFHTVFNFIIDGNGSAFSEIQYWAVMDMADGTEGKAISFTVNNETIDAISNKRIIAEDLAVHVKDLWVHSGLE